MSINNLNVLMSSQCEWFVVKKITLFQNTQGVRSSESVLMQNSVSKKVETVVFLGLSLLKETTPYWNLHRICLLEYCICQQKPTCIMFLCQNPCIDVILVKCSHFLLKSSYFNISPLTSAFSFLSSPPPLLSSMLRQIWDSSGGDRSRLRTPQRRPNQWRSAW